MKNKHLLEFIFTFPSIRSMCAHINISHSTVLSQLYGSSLVFPTGFVVYRHKWSIKTEATNFPTSDHWLLSDWLSLWKHWRRWGVPIQSCHLEWHFIRSTFASSSSTPLPPSAQPAHGTGCSSKQRASHNECCEAWLTRPISIHIQCTVRRLSFFFFWLASLPRDPPKLSTWCC